MSLRNIDLGRNQLEQIEDNVFRNYPQLLKLNLSDNNINSLGNNLGLLDNPDIEIDISNNDITYLLGMLSLFYFFFVNFKYFFKNVN